MTAPIALLARKGHPNLGYRLGLLIGRGGCGEVWRALSPSGKPVAVKFLPCDSDRAATRELRALQSIRQLQHPHLIGTHEIWAEPRRVAVAMELAEGSLLDLLHVSLQTTGDPLRADHACFCLRQAARVLDFLNTRQHQIGGRRVAVRHCDVKPSNLLLFSTTVKLADFSFSAQSETPVCGFQRAGTLHYAAPEVFQGWISDRTDQYALAVTYYQLRTGRYPFPEIEKFSPDYVRPAPDLSLLSAAEIPIVRHALHPVPQDRWHSCIEFVDELQQAIKSNST